MALILLRHTRPRVPEGTCYGRTDLDLHDDFAGDAAKIATQLPEFKRILSSPLSRCLRLALALGQARGHEVEVDTRLTEMDFGRWEHQPWDQIPRAEIDAWQADFHEARPHGGESVSQLAGRVQAGLDAAAAGPVPALVVTHAGVIKAAHAARGTGDGWQTQTGFGQWVRIDWPCL